MLFLLLLIWGVYFLLVIACWRTWNSIGTTPVKLDRHRLPAVSVVIALRNEAHNLPALMESLRQQDYPREKLQIVAVDDNSQDGTADLLDRYADDGTCNLICIRLKDPADFKGSFKKRALTAGIEMARHPFIVTTDADCQFHPSWLSSVTALLQEQHLQMVSGPVSLITTNNGGQLLAEMEQAALIAIGASFMKWGYPNMCNGANLAFTKTAFEEVAGYQGYQQVVSGDDEFLLYKISKKYPRQLRFIKQDKAVVRTAAPEDWRHLIQQRRRWSSKWKYHQSMVTRSLAVFIFVFHLVWVTTLGLVIAGYYPLTWWIPQVVLKLGAEYVLIKSVMKLQHKRLRWGWFLAGQFVYSFYVILMGLTANKGGYRWKNREYR